MMSSSRYMFVLLLPAAVLFSPFPAAGDPVSTEGFRSTRIEFTAYEQEEKLPVPGTNLTMFLSAGYGRPDMDAVDRYVDHINTHFSGTVSHVNHYNQKGFGVEWRGSKNLFAGMDFQWIDAVARGSTMFSGKTASFRIDLDAGGLEVYGGFRVSRLLGPLGFEALAGAGYYRSRYREKENGYDVAGKDWATGFRGGLGILIEFLEHGSLHVNGSYRHLKFDGYDDGGGPVRFVSPGHPAAEADFSGFLLEGRAAWRF